MERTLEVSDNQAAEVLARHVGLAERQEGSFVAGTEAILEVLEWLGVPVTGAQLYDGSGLSRQNRLTTDTPRRGPPAGHEPEHPGLRQVLTGLPVAGFTGSLAYRFDRGRPRPGTGARQDRHADRRPRPGRGGRRRDRRQMAFVVVADRVRPPRNFRHRR